MCDTFVVLPGNTADGSLIFGKNSDREPNEAQSLEFHPAARPEGKRVRCTYCEVPQATPTIPVVLSRPFWMWGAEMGINENGVVIGNEAVFTRMPATRATGHLTGMDMLRLALERATTAEAAVECMVGLLADHGQGGVCGYADKRMTYHNSYIAADPTSAWLLETAGPYWAARRVADRCSISNALTIGEDYDRIHPDAVDHATKKGWRPRHTDFSFAAAYSDWFFTTFSASRTRQRRSAQCLAPAGTAFSLTTAMATLRDHGIADAPPSSGFLGSTICAHAANPIARSATQTTGSMIAHMTPSRQTLWATGTSAPCTSAFKPIRFEGPVLPDLGPTPGARYQAETYWWRHERCHRTLLADWAGRTRGLAGEQSALEREWMSRVDAAGDGAIIDLTREAFTRAGAMTEHRRRKAMETPVAKHPAWMYRRYWRRQNENAGIRIAD